MDSKDLIKEHKPTTIKRRLKDECRQSYLPAAVLRSHRIHPRKHQRSGVLPMPITLPTIPFTFLQNFRNFRVVATFSLLLTLPHDL